MILETLVKIDDKVIGHIPCDGPRYLDRAAFLALRPTERLRAYLGLVAPAARKAAVVARVCGVAPENIGSFLRADMALGRIQRPRRGEFAVIRAAHTTVHLQRVTRQRRDAAGQLALVTRDGRP